MTRLSADQINRQYNEWGVVIANTNGRGAHIANGLVQLLRLYPTLRGEPHLTLSPRAGVDRPGQLTQATVSLLKARFGDAWTLNDAARGLCVARSKHGPLSLDAAHAPHDEAHAAIMTAARQHVERCVEGALFDEDTRQLIADTLNADGRVYINGGTDVSASGLRLAGYMSTHTIRPMHAMTYLGALAATPAGVRALDALYALLEREDDPHTALTRMLGLGTTPDERAAETTTLTPAYPLPSDAEGWSAFAALTAQMTTRLLDWTRGAAKAEALESIVELIGLLLSSKLWSWGDAEVLLVSPIAPRRRDLPVMVEAQRSWQRALTTLDQRSTQRDLHTSSYPPSAALRTLARVTGWLTPKHARGGAKHHLGPDARRLTTLIRALVAPGEELGWEALRQRALALRIELGGAMRDPNAPIAPLMLRRAAELNRESLILLGLARQESDDVIRIDGGGVR